MFIIDLRFIESIDQSVKILRILEFDTDQGGAALPVVLLSILESGDVIIGPQYVEKLSERSCTLRKPHDKVVLLTFIEHGALFDLLGASDVIITTTEDADDILAFDFIFKFVQCCNGAGTCRLYYNRLFIVKIEDRTTHFALWDQY